MRKFIWTLALAFPATLLPSRASALEIAGVNVNFGVFVNVCRNGPSAPWFNSYVPDSCPVCHHGGQGAAPNNNPSGQAQAPTFPSPYWLNYPMAGQYPMPAVPPYYPMWGGMPTPPVENGRTQTAPPAAPMPSGPHTSYSYPYYYPYYYYVPTYSNYAYGWTPAPLQDHPAAKDRPATKLPTTIQSATYPAPSAQKGK